MSNIKNYRLLFPVLATNVPSGGRNFIYHVVDFLNEVGIEAWVVHPGENFRLTWFKNRTNVGYSIDLFPNQKKIKQKNRIKYFWPRKSLKKGIKTRRITILDTGIFSFARNAHPSITSDGYVA